MKRKQILITNSFRKHLKKLRRQFSENDVIDNIRDFIRLGLRHGETILASESFGSITIASRLSYIGIRNKRPEIQKVANILIYALTKIKNLLLSYP